MMNKIFVILTIIFLLGIVSIYIARSSYLIQVDVELSDKIEQYILENHSLCVNEFVDNCDEVLIDNCYHFETALKKEIIRGKCKIFAHNDEMIILFLEDRHIVKAAQCTGQSADALRIYEYQHMGNIFPSDYVFTLKSSPI